LETTVKAADGTALAAAESWTFTTAACPCSLFSSTLLPASQNNPVQDGRTGAGPWSYEMGVKVSVDQPMQLNAIRFFKGSAETGTHIGRVWTAAGTQLAQVTFATESASGWQQQTLGSPITLQPGTTYVVSVGFNAVYSFTPGGLAAQIVSGPLRSVADGLNGVYGASAGSFPSLSWNSSNYFVDLEAIPAGDPGAPSVLSTTPTNGATGIARGATVNATFSRAMDATTITATTFRLTGPSGQIAATVAYNAATTTATLTPSAPLAYNTSYTATITTGARASDGTPLAAPATWTFTTAAAVPPTVTTTIPTNGATDIGTGVQPRATFNKDIDPATLTTSTFTLTGPSGTITGSVGYDAPTRTTTFTPTNPLTAGASYTARLAPAITATDGSTLATPYTWTFTVASVVAPLQVTSTTPAGGAVDILRTTVVVKATFNRSLDPASVTGTTFLLRAPGGAAVAASVSYDAATRTATLTPTAALTASTTYTAEANTGIKAIDGAPLATTTTWSFTTGACPCSLFAAQTPDKGGNSTRDGRGGSGPFTLELGVKLIVSRTTRLTAVRFYKDPTETGLHTVTVWTAAGTRLLQVPVTAETASGWQQQALSTPFELTPGTVYVVSVNANANYGVTQNALATAVTVGPVSTVADGQNGVYGPTAGVLPTNSFRTSNYFVDVVVE
jgi:hypothetical protein